MSILLHAPSPIKKLVAKPKPSHFVILGLVIGIPWIVAGVMYLLGITWE